MPLTSLMFKLLWVASLEPFYHGLELRNHDLQHLAAFGCVRIGTVGTRDLKQVLAGKSKGAEPEWVVEFLDTGIGRWLNEIWDKGLTRVFQTSVGSLIGVYVGDRQTGARTDMSIWA